MNKKPCATVTASISLSTALMAIDAIVDKGEGGDFCEADADDLENAAKRIRSKIVADHEKKPESGNDHL